MAARKYTSAELLELREHATHCSANDALAKIARHLDIADLLVKGHGETNARPASVHHGRRSRSTKEETSMSTEDSDEQILFRGKRLAAQQSEGFKRFYKAVVSPSHVRVTAGGRIVPNTRPSSSPTTKWDRESTPTQVAEPARPTHPDQGYAINGPLGPMALPPSMYGQFMHFPQMVTHMPTPVPLFHLPNGYPMAYGNPPMPYLPDPVASHPAQFHGSRPHENAKEENSQDGRSTDETSTKKSRPPPILVMPPDVRDPCRPLMLHGQLVYPRLPAPGFMHSPYYSAPAMGSFPFPPPALPPMGQPASAPPVPTPAGPYMVPSETSSINSADRTNQPVMPAKQVSTPPLSSIKPSSVTKRQLDSLRSSLKYYEDQLAYNKHQIDEKGTQEQARKIRQSIAQFEHNLRLQQEFEAINYPKQMSESDATASSYSEYSYPRELTAEEKRAREIYWGQESNKGTGLPKFDGKDFYPPSPVKLEFFDRGHARQQDSAFAQKSQSETHDPALSTATAPRSKAGRKLSHAIPIVAPSDGSVINHIDAAAQRGRSSVTGEHREARSLPSQEDPAVNRANTRPVNDLWHSMMRNGSTGGTTTPTTITSATATGYLPQYFGHAAASLMPSMPNVQSLSRNSATDKYVGVETVSSPLERFGENRPPPANAGVAESDAVKGLHERLQRDDERRPV
ncbi:hypothetical protein Micbo1qcDRAFT_199898 [Microdochium bolleyi]|uniref:Uncharacterized protein n=1 Tax=Microdochium bolleyi TaxID=196109 RepID=A0A136JJ76_9PEZI|nr:hypothetical protein Micbo1qcDRAFT_199898 [Microdochium bolleyi]